MNNVKKIKKDYFTIFLDHKKRLRALGLEQSVSWIKEKNKKITLNKQAASWETFSSPNNQSCVVDFEALNINKNEFSKFKKSLNR